MTYDLRRLRLRGLIERIPHSQRYSAHRRRAVHALVVPHVIIFGYGHGLQRAIIDESQHRTPERLIMAQH